LQWLLGVSQATISRMEKQIERQEIDDLREGD